MYDYILSTVWSCGILGLWEKVQNKMTTLLHHGNISTPQQRNNVLGITSHEQRRLRGDLVNMSKNNKNQSFFTLRNNARIRGNDNSSTKQLGNKETIIRSLICT